jgi:hypothetical protein
MGTRSLTLVYDEVLDGEYVRGALEQRTKQVPIINMYRQFDGYISVHGLELAKFLKPIRITNGISGDPTNTANGMGCLAAQIVLHFKKSVENYRWDKSKDDMVSYDSHVGNIYLYPTDARDCGQEYEYHVYENKVEVHRCYDSKLLFSGTWSEFYDFCNKPEDDDSN